MPVYEPEEQPEFDMWEQFGSIQIRADLFGLHISEEATEQEIWADAEEAEKLIRFAQFWLPKIKAARTPKCPNCRKEYPDTPEENQVELKPSRKGHATEWNCLYCGKSYTSGPFGTDLQEVKATAANPGNGDDFDPFIDSDDLP